MSSTESDVANNAPHADAEQPTRIVERDGVRYTILGTAHVSKASVEAVERKQSWKHTAVYPYFDTDGGLSYVKVRFIDKLVQWGSKGGKGVRPKPAA